MLDTLRKTGLGITAAMYGMGDGKVRHVIAELAAWFAEGVLGGVHEGLGEGMAIIGAAPRRPHGLAESR